MVLDSSVIFKWFYQEKDTDKALYLYKNIKEERTALSLPRLIFYEIGNIILYHKPYSQDKIFHIKETLEILPVSFYDFNFREWYEIIERAHQSQISFYDNTYVYLAQKLNTQLITADKKLFEKTRKSGLVKLL